MSWQLVLRRRATAEIQETHNFYETLGSGLGQQFLDELERVFTVLGELPLAFPIVHRDVRRALTKQFPYAIWFRIRGERVVVLSVLHQARDPARWPK